MPTPRQPLFATQPRIEWDAYPTPHEALVAFAAELDYRGAIIEGHSAEFAEMQRARRLRLAGMPDRPESTSPAGA